MLCVQLRRVPVVMESMLCRRLHTPWMVIPVVVDLAEDEPARSMLMAIAVATSYFMLMPMVLTRKYNKI